MQTLADGLEHSIAFLVASQVVHLLEAIHVHVKERGCLAVAAVAGGGLIQCLFEGAAIGKPRERIVERKAFQLLFRIEHTQAQSASGQVRNGGRDEGDDGKTGQESREIVVDRGKRGA